MKKLKMMIVALLCALGVAQTVNTTSGEFGVSTGYPYESPYYRSSYCYNHPASPQCNYGYYNTYPTTGFYFGTGGGYRRGYRRRHHGGRHHGKRHGHK